MLVCKKVCIFNKVCLVDKRFPTKENEYRPLTAYCTLDLHVDVHVYIHIEIRMLRHTYCLARSPFEPLHFHMALWFCSPVATSPNQGL